MGGCGAYMYVYVCSLVGTKDTVREARPALLKRALALGYTMHDLFCWASMSDFCVSVRRKYS